MRPKIVLATIGSLGDLHPFIAIGQALRARGAWPVLAVPHDHVSKCREAGLDAEAILPSFEELGRETGLDDDEIVRRVMADKDFLVGRILLPPLDDSADRLVAIAAGADAIVGSIFALAAPIAAETLSLPFVAAMLQPMAWFSPHDPPIGPGFRAFAKPPLGPVGLGWNRLVDAMIAATLKRRYAKRIDAARARHGLPRSRMTPVLRPGTRPALSLGLYSAILGPPPIDAPQPAALTGFPRFDSADGQAATLDPDLAAFLADGDLPLVVSLGSFLPFAAQDFYRSAAAVALELGMRAVLVTPTDPEISEPDVKIVGYAPHSLLFPHAAAIIHHGGIGTTGQALAAGKPQLIVPFMADQFDNAARLTKLGVGISTTAKNFLADGPALVKDTLVNADYRTRAISIARHLQSEDGAAMAAGMILGTIGCG